MVLYVVVVEDAVDGWAGGLEAYGVVLGIVEYGCFDGGALVWVVDDETECVSVWNGEDECSKLVCGGGVEVG